MDVKKIQNQLARFADERDWDQFHNPKNLAMALSVEASELVEIFQWLTAEQSAAIMQSSEAEHVGEEVADILIYLLRLADKLGIDLEQVVAEKIRKNGEKYRSEDKDRLQLPVFEAEDVAAQCSVIAVGGAGRNFINAIASQGYRQFLVDSEDEHLDGHATFISLAAEQANGWRHIQGAVAGIGLVVLAGGMGGATASVIIPELAGRLLRQGMRVLVIAHRPFQFEGESRMEEADRAIQMLQQIAGLELHVMENEKLMHELGEDTALSAAFAVADQRALAIIQGAME